MIGRRKLLAGLLALGACALVVALAVPNRADTASRKRCSTRGAQTLVATEDAVIFARHRRDGDFAVARVYGCVHSVGRAQALGVSRVNDAEQDADGPTRYLNSLHLAGNFAAWVDVSCPKAGPCRKRIQELNLRTGKRKRQAPAGSAFDPLVLARNGFLAWITTSEDGRCSPCSVHRYAGTDVVLDSGAAISPRSLALESGAVVNAYGAEAYAETIYWTTAGVAHSAPMRP